jgi:hypothetical protein
MARRRDSGAVRTSEPAILGIFCYDTLAGSRERAASSASAAMLAIA